MIIKALVTIAAPAANDLATEDHPTDVDSLLTLLNSREFRPLLK